MNIRKVRDTITTFIKVSVPKSRGVVIGLSGGIDSTLTCQLAIDALGAERVTGIIIKNNRYSSEDLKKVEEYAKKTGIKLKVIDSTGLTKDILQIFDYKLPVEKSSSIDARMTDFIIRNYAMIKNKVYLGTINGTERLTGWYPKASLVGDFCPLGGLLKTHEKLLAKECGLENLIETVSESADKICSGCGRLANFDDISYEELDEILYIYETRADYKRILKENFDTKKVNKILKRIGAVKHKHDLFAKYPRIYQERS